jgi:hypothetical protein
MVTGPIQELLKKHRGRIVFSPQLDGKNSKTANEGQGVPEEEPK